MAALVVVGTAPNDFPTLTAPILGRQIPSPQSDISFWLDLAAAAFAGVFGARVARHRLAGTLVAALVVALGVFLLIALVWRIHAPASAGNGA